MNMRILLVIGVVLLLAACGPTPQQNVVGPTGSVVEEPDEPSVIVIEEPNVSDDVLEAPAEEEQVSEPEEKTPPAEYTARWAYEETRDLSKSWASDARLYSIRGFNLIEGRITNNYYMVSDRRAFTSYFIVSYIAESLDNREVIDFRVTFAESRPDYSRRFLPGSGLGDATMADMAINSDEVSEILDDLNQGWGYSIKSMELTSAGFIKEKLMAPGAEALNTLDGPTTREDAYEDIPDNTPIALAETFFNVIYEINLMDGSVIGFREPRD
jgi:hypothetical protein